MGKTLASFFHIWALRFQGISRALLGPVPGPRKEPVQVSGPEDQALLASQ